MAQEYLPILVQVIFAIGFAGFALFLSVVIGRVGKRSLVKDTAYECGMLPLGEAQPLFSVKFYLVAMLFILCDIEIVFMYPWAVVYRDMLWQKVANADHTFSYVLQPGILLDMFGFIGLFFVGFLSALK